MNVKTIMKTITKMMARIWGTGLVDGGIDKLKGDKSFFLNLKIAKREMPPFEE